MPITTLPPYNMDQSETGCCPRFETAGWDGAELEFYDQLFVLAKTVSIMHVPLNMGSVIKKTYDKVEKAQAQPEDYYLILSTEPSPWRGEHYFAVTKNVPDAENVKLSGSFLAKAFEGPYRDAGKWVSEMEAFVAAQEK